MSAAAPLPKLCTHDLGTHTDLQGNPFSVWNTGPGSPPFVYSPPYQQPPDSSTLSTPSTDFEFDSLSFLQIKDDNPVSPKLIPSSGAGTSGFWAASATATTALAVSSVEPLPHVPEIQTQAISPPTPTQQPSTPPSPSVRQLMAEEKHSDHEDDLHSGFDSVDPSTPMRTSARKSNPKQMPFIEDEPFWSIATGDERRKSTSTLADRQAFNELAPQYKHYVLQSCRSEPNSHPAFSRFSSAIGEKREEVEKSGVKKQGGKMSMKSAFKDLLRKTVPSSNAEAHYITRIMGAGSSKRYIPSTKSNPASPTHSSSMSIPPAAAQPSTPRRSSAHGSSSPARSTIRHPPSPTGSSARIRSGNPVPSLPRSPLSPHAIHYEQNKAHSLELNRKTFLPYRQSLLGCLGGSAAFPSEQQAW